MYALPVWEFLWSVEFVHPWNISLVQPTWFRNGCAPWVLVSWGGAQFWAWKVLLWCVVLAGTHVFPSPPDSVISAEAALVSALQWWAKSTDFIMIPSRLCCSLEFVHDLIPETARTWQKLACFITKSMNSTSSMPQKSLDSSDLSLGIF